MASKDFSYEMQKMFLELMITNHELFARVQNIFDYTNFDKKLQPTANFIGTYANEYSSVPTIQQIKAETGLDVEKVDNINDTIEEWFFDEYEQFCRHESLKKAILKSADLLEKGEYGPVEKIIKDAVQISLTRDLGIDYFEDPKKRLNDFKEKNNMTSTGWKDLDFKLFGGFCNGTLNIFAGGSGSGKSVFKQNIALNWVEMGLDGIFISLELSQALCAMRIDSMLTAIPSRDIYKNLDDVEMKVAIAAKKYGNLQIKYLPAQSTTNDIRTYVRELMIKTGMKPRFLIIDYLDLIMPSGVKVSPSDVFTKDKFVCEELRNMAAELNLMLVTSSQLNRSAVEEIEYDQSHIAGGISKINTADNVMAIHTSRSMRENGEYQLQLLKTRSSSGVGQKINLSFDIDTLRITDSDKDDSQQKTTIYDSIKHRSSVPQIPVGNESAVSGEVQSAKLKNLLNNLRT